MKISIREACPGDIEKLQPVNHSAKSKVRQHYKRIDSVSQQDITPTTLIVAELDGFLVGRCEFSIEKSEIYFSSLGVLEAHRRQGVFKAIFNYLEAVGRSFGCGAISCETIEETGN